MCKIFCLHHHSKKEKNVLKDENYLVLDDYTTTLDDSCGKQSLLMNLLWILVDGCLTGLFT